ncbi:FKBP-type peptidyl-prolyl cis-trans isomerase [Tautonia plasticadhaerens]|uniref:Peptidyl-prolyl cis-trans isomerase n=1 Tax=Tautonia plasticadhaerens TaxID=2527974 RepID=A0A518GVG8_9BACT|nr:FKBP-type peptidyl-prolyl cis-trans isomerase [Tautonia plasticadhaerens]QDV32582.1 Outer membrane protein MIP precursor [Tautonia plasticadhaerens]
MSRRSIGLLAGCAAALTIAGGPPQGPEAAPVPPDELRTRASYGLGLNAGRVSKQQGIEVDPEAFARGLRDGLSGGEPPYTEEQLSEALLAFQQQLMLKQEQLIREVGARLSREGRAFLQLNATRPGVTRLPSGLQYKVVREGSGPSPRAGDTVFVRYKGTLTDGTLIEDSAEMGGVISVPLERVIPGWREALLLMEVGSKWELFIPPDLAYGPDPPAGGPVPPNAVLVYEVELLAIE